MVIQDFSNIDTEEKAYLLGILAADGCMKQRGDYYCLSFGLTSYDKDHVRKVAGLISPDIKTHEYHYTSDRKPMTYFDVGVQTLCKQFLNHGIIPRKSKILKPPSFLSPSLVRHYIRGYFDGDGSVFITKENKLGANCVGTRSVLDFINKHFLEFYSNRTQVTKSGQGELCHLKFSGKTAVAFLNYIYSDAVIYLPRKYEKAKDYLVPLDKFTGYINGLKMLDAWSKEEEKFLIESYSHVSLKSISEKLGRTHKAVSEKAHRLGLIRHEVFTKEEQQYLRDNYTKKTRSQVARHLDKSLRAVLNEVRRLKREGIWEKYE